MALTDKLNAIGDAIRSKTGKTGPLTLDQMPTEIRSIVGEYQENRLALFMKDQLANVTVDDLYGMTSIPSYAFYKKKNIKTINIPNTVTSISQSAFEGCAANGIILSPNVNTIYSGAFKDCTSMQYYDFTGHTSVPTLQSSNAFSGIPSTCEIRVPSVLYNTWRTSANWTAYSNYLVPYIENGIHSDVSTVYVDTSGEDYISFSVQVKLSDKSEPIMNFSVNPEHEFFYEISHTTSMDTKSGICTVDITISDIISSRDVTITAINSNNNSETYTFVVHVKHITEEYATIQYLSDVRYGFEQTYYNSCGYVYESTNKAVDDSYALGRLSFKLDDSSSKQFIMQCINYGEDEYDYGIVSQLDKQLSASTNDDGASGSGNVFKNFKGIQSPDFYVLDFGMISAGYHTVDVKYIKDGIDSYNNDSLRVKLFKVWGLGE